jgi:hypothetical protein
MNKNVPPNFSFVPWIGPAATSRSALPFEGKRVTVYVGVRRIGKVRPFADQVFRAFDLAEKPLGFYPDIESAAWRLWREFLLAEEEAARIKAGHPPTPTFDRKEAVYAGGMLIGTVSAFSDGTALAFDGAGKLLAFLPTVDLAKKICQGVHNDRPGFSTNSVN